MSVLQQYVNDTVMEIKVQNQLLSTLSHPSVQEIWNQNPFSAMNTHLRYQQNT